MVIHDMRNPTSSIQFGLEQLLNKLKDYDKEYKKLQELLDINQPINYEDT